MLYLIIIFIFIFGTLIGSFLNCLIFRLHKGEGILPSFFGGKSAERSYCPKCKKQIAWYDNIPILSYFLLRGKCRKCRKTISIQYPIVEFITGVLFVVAFIVNINGSITPPLIPPFTPLSGARWGTLGNYFQLSLPAGEAGISSFIIPNSLFILHLLLDWYIIAIMVIIFVYDLRWYLILDCISLPACAVVFIFNLLLGISWQNLLISGIIGGGFFLLQFVISGGKWIGGGDIRLGLLMGLALGWPNIIVALILAYFIGAIFSIGLLLMKKKKWGSMVPLGVFLAPATIIALFWGQEIVNWYLNLI